MSISRIAQTIAPAAHPRPKMKSLSLPDGVVPAMISRLHVHSRKFGVIVALGARCMEVLKLVCEAGWLSILPDLTALVIPAEVVYRDN